MKYLFFLTLLLLSLASPAQLQTINRIDKIAPEHISYVNDTRMNQSAFMASTETPFFHNVNYPMFDGRNAYCDNFTLDPGIKHTISFWFHPNRLSSVGYVLGSSMSESYLSIDFSMVNPVITYAVNGLNKVDITWKTYSGEKWYFLALVRSNTNVSLYINGAKIGSATLTTDQNPIFNYIGHHSGRYWSGMLDQIAINIAEFSQSDVLSLFGEGIPTRSGDPRNYSNPLCFWTFDVETFPTLPDEVAGNFNARLVNLDSSSIRSFYNLK
jgi:hypothetical protein